MQQVSILQLFFCKPAMCEPEITPVQGLNAKVWSLDVSDFMNQDALRVYDIVVCMDVFARFVDPVRAFLKVAKVLREPGGILLANSPFSGNFRPRSGPPILAKVGNLWFKHWAKTQGLVITGVWSEGSFGEYMKELAQRAVGCKEECGAGRPWHRGFMFRIEKGAPVMNEQIIAGGSYQAPPCMNKTQALPRPNKNQDSTWVLTHVNRGNPGTRDHWMGEKARLLCSARGGAERPKVLDVSAGNRPYLKVFQDAGCRYYSNEFAGNAQILDDFRGEQRKQLKVHDYLGPDVTNTTAPSYHFDVVLLTEVLEHVPDALAAVKELRRVAKVGANILVTSPLTSGPHQLPFHFAAGYSQHWYVAVGEALGLEVVSLEPQGDVYALLAQECSIKVAPVAKDVQAFLTASLSPEHAIGWMAHFRKT